MTATEISGRTAVARKKASLPVRWFVRNTKIVGSVLYHGRGKDKKGAKMLSHRAWKIKSYDPNFPYIRDEKTLDEQYDVVISTYVLNTLPPEERKKVIKQIAEATRGKALISVRGAGDLRVRSGWHNHDDGYTTSVGTFQKFYTKDELYKELKQEFQFVDIIRGGDGSKALFAVATNNL